MDYKVKLGATLEFDAEKEKDIIDQLQELTAHRRLGEFISHTIRVVLENPELLTRTGISLDKFGITSERNNFYKGIEKQMGTMQDKIDTIYDMAVKTYSLAQFGKKVGLEEKSQNMLQAQFILQRQSEELCKTLGLASAAHIYESNKVDTIENKVDSIVEYIIDSYSGITNEIISEANRKAVTEHIDNSIEKIAATKENYEYAMHNNTNKEVASDKITMNNQLDNSKVQIDTQSDNTKNNSELSINNKETQKDNEDEIVDFGKSADIDALLAFISD